MSDKTVKELQFKFSAQDEASSVFAKVGDNAQKAAKKAEGGGDTFGQRIKAKLKEERAEGVNATERLFANGGRLGIEQLLGGGIAIAATNFALEGIVKFGSTAQESLKKVREGTMSVGEAVFETATKIPVLGTALEAGAAIGKFFVSLFSEVPVITAAAREEAKQLADEYIRAEKALKAMREAAYQWEKTAAAEGKIGSTSARLKANDELGDRLEDIEKKRSKGELTGQQAFDFNARAFALNADAMKRADEMDADETRRSQQEIQDIEAEGADIRLRQLGKTHEAELADIERQQQAKIRMIQETADKEEKSNPDQSDRIRQEASEKLDALMGRNEAELAAKREQFQKEDFEHRKAINDELFNQEIELLAKKAESETGSDRQRDERQVERMKKVQELQKQEAQSQAIIDDKTASQASKERAARLLKDTKAEEQKVAEASDRIPQPLTGRTFNLESSRFLTGLSQASKENNPMTDTAKNTAALLAGQKQQNILLAALSASLAGVNIPAF